jgi:predicted HNH restriction endonuclease
MALTPEERRTIKQMQNRAHYAANREIIRQRLNEQRRQAKVADPDQFRRHKESYVQRHKLRVYAARNKRKRERNAEYKEAVLLHYGSKCACCDDTHIQFLDLDHINGDGGKHRIVIFKKYLSIWHWLVIHNFPEGFRVLCSNCNGSLGRFGYCPHQIERGEITLEQAMLITQEHKAKVCCKQRDAVLKGGSAKIKSANGSP